MNRNGHRFPRRLLSLLLALCLLASVLSATLLTAFAAPELPPANSQPRHMDCTALSDAAMNYYTGDYSYAALSALPGAADASDSWAAMQNNPLYDALQTLMSETQTAQCTYSGYSPGALAYYWARTDAVNGGDTYIMFYSDVDPSGYTMNREHVWPKSRASYYQKFGGADLHHLRPSVSTLNSAKSNHMFGYVKDVYSGYTTGTVGGNVAYYLYGSADRFECKDDVKGDVARILLYVYVRWGQPNLYSDVAADKLPAMDPDDTQNTGDRVVESLDTLLEWCELDPVDSWEMERNDLTAQVQGNRNVFIDYPELAWLLFGRVPPADMTTPSGEAANVQTEDVTVTFSVLGDTGMLEPVTCSAGTGITLPVAEAPDGLSFLGWVGEDYDNVAERPGTILTGDYTAEGDVTLLALFTYNDYGANPPTLTKMTVDDTFSDGDKIVIAESGGEHGLYQKSHNYAYVSDFDFTDDAEAILADELKYFDVTEVEGGWYLGDETNGWLYTPDNTNNLTIRNNTAFMTAFTLTTLEGHLALQHTVSYNDNVFYVNCATNINGALQNKWRMVNANNMSGVSTLEIYKLDEGGPAVAVYTTLPRHVHVPGEPVQENVVEATCTEPGGYDTVTYCTGCGLELSREHTELPAPGHDWGEWCPVPVNFCTDPRVETRTCNRCGAVESRTLPPDGHVPGEPVKENALAPTCEAVGGYDMVIYCTACGAELSREHTELAALGHDWDEPSYEWADDCSTVTATRVCRNDETHVETETVDTASEVTKEPTYTEEGEIVYTAVFENEAFEAQTRAETLPVKALFEDVVKGAFYYDAVLWAVGHDPQITNGIDATHFGPGNTCTRGQVVTFLWRANGMPQPTKTENPFEDVAAGKYYYDAVLWAVEKEITSGVDPTHFKPDSECTRAQVVTFLWRTEGQPEPTSEENPFEDVTGGFYYKAVLWAVENKITAGVDATHFKPGNTCTRGQIVTFLWRDLG